MHFRRRFAALFLAACVPSAAAAKPATWGIDLSDQDRSIRPGDDFAMYENGSWYARTILMPQQANAAYWRDLRVDAGKRIDQLLADLDARDPKQLTRTEALVAAFHRSSKDEAAINRAGLAPLEPQFANIRAARNKAAFAELMGRTEGPGTVRQPTARAERGHDFFMLQVVEDQQDPSHYALSISQGGLLLPGPEYYTDPSFADIKSAYQTYIANMLRLLRWPEPDRNAAKVVALETAIARVSSSLEELQDPSKTYHRVSLRELSRLAPDFPWRAFLKGAGVPAGAPLAIDVPAVARGIGKIYATTPLDVLRAKQAFGAAHVNAARLPSDIYNEYRHFALTALAGIQAGPSRDLDVINLVEASIPDAVGAVYAQRYSSPAIKAKVEAMTGLMKNALDGRIARSSWLSPEGIAQAHSKIANMHVLIGYPDKFDTYSGLRIEPDDFFGNVARSAAYAWKSQVGKLNQPFDRHQWSLTPFYPQYFYDPTRNVVEVPAALLVPPFFNIDADDAVNYGADGTTIGAQMVAALFSSGANHDAAGRLRSWLPQADAERLQLARGKIATLYSREEPLPGMHLKGDLLANEALEDIGGVQIALDAYHASLVDKLPPVLDGYTGDQRFFLGRAQMWRAKFSPEFTRNQVATGSNAPPYMRINGPASNLDAWYSAFDIRAGDKLYIPPDQRIRLW